MLPSSALLGTYSSFISGLSTGNLKDISDIGSHMSYCFTIWFGYLSASKCVLRGFVNIDGHGTCSHK